MLSAISITTYLIKIILNTFKINEKKEKNKTTHFALCTSNPEDPKHIVNGNFAESLRNWW
jgi:hypothetical protein